MDQQKNKFECGLITFNELQVEKCFLGKTPDQVQKYMGKEADVNNGNEWIYIIKRFYYGIYCRKLYLYFHDGKVEDFYL